MQFRIPQTLDGFETAAREGGLVSQEAFAAAKSKPPPSLKRAGRGDAIWNEESCVQLYSFLYHIDGHGLKASQLQLVAQAVSSAGLSAAEPNQALDSSCSHNGTDLSLSIFFTCQMLQHVEVSPCT